MWYQDVYFHRRDWLLAHFDKLDMTVNELVLVLLVDYLNQDREAKITHDLLMSKSKLSAGDFNLAIDQLLAKKYLVIYKKSRDIIFSIDGIFQRFEDEKKASSALVSMFEREFGRPLTQSDLEDLNALVAAFDEKYIIHGLRQAVSANKCTMAYIRGVIQRVSQADAS